MSDSLTAVFGDVHSNLEALQAVLADMKSQGVQRHYCMGDIVGYGPDPAACVELVRSMGCLAVMGNHDEAAAGNSPLAEMSPPAQAGIDYSRKALSAEQRAWLANLPLQFAEDGCQFVHGSLDDPGKWWYVMTPGDATLHFRAQTLPICFCGHTHDPMVWNWTGAGKLTIRHGEGRIALPEGGKILINAGSVGQPRDLNPDACYALFNPRARWVEFRRISYNISKTKRKIVAARLPRFSAQRLSEGK